ncbi:MAG: hypothetical protein ACKV0T_09650 [Planctomycetales bacterium]
MASSSKPTGVHYALVFFVLAWIVCLTGWIIVGRGTAELRTQATNATKKATDTDASLKKSLDEIDRIKKKLGSLHPEVGDDDTNANTVVGEMANLIKLHGQGVASPTYNETLVKMAEALANARRAQDALQVQLTNELALFQQKTNELNEQLKNEKQARELADKGKIDADSLHAEELAKKEQDIADQRRALDELNQEYAEYKEAAEKLQKQLTQRVANLLSKNRQLGDELEQATRISFEIEDGKIVSIDAVAKRVTINLGEIDGLRPRTGFSVYRKKNAGVGRGARQGSTGPEDIKAAIEVTKILGPHLAEARILDEDIYNPIGKGDPIYSPIWSPGRGESISIVGTIDLDGDGRGDPDLLHEQVAATGAIIDNYVDEKGELFVNGKSADKPVLTEKTKFLVKGHIPDLGESGDPDEQAAIRRILDFQKEMNEQARERGIRVISLSDFLSFMGYKTQRRLFVPGDDSSYTLQNGARKAMIEHKANTNASSGDTAGIYSKDKTRRNTNSDGKPGKFRVGAEK